MEVSELLLWVARLGVLVLMYLFLLALILALRADARAAAAAQQPAAPAQAPSRPAEAPIPRAPTPRSITVVGGTMPTTGGKYQLFNTLEIGRDSACAISIPSRFVSTLHARISSLQGAWVIEDLGSTNGTLLNGQPVQAPHPLAPGDHIMVGDTEFAVG